MKYQLTTKFAREFLKRAVGYDLFDEELCDQVKEIMVDREWGRIEVFNQVGRIIETVRIY